MAFTMIGIPRINPYTIVFFYYALHRHLQESWKEHPVLYINLSLKQSPAAIKQERIRNEQHLVPVSRGFGFTHPQHDRLLRILFPK
ncbi:hypothetical protein K504DRAFT_90838 [Pleomassaria siparia CBS 279.74]|uniref:Uncharacterized protein n=1 Tax=Pleomassaria siparia CBS 279.74 TaxID=1314801 RepID=A0A6G1JYU9_9PLEO|nr:hypothetical protein K504DRAFT_90838 [Pleomassaria siparia CBS 279.74]